MDQSPLARWWSLAAGLVLIGVGAGGFETRVATSAALNMVHVVSGVLALLACAHMTNGARANALVALGILYALIFVVVSTSPAVFGLFAVAQNAPLSVIDFGMAAVSFTVGLMARASLAPVRA